MAKKRDGSTGADPASDGPDQAAHGAPASVAWLELFATVFSTGFAVMLVEILGTRIIGPVFGVGLFVWSALLAVALASLAAGYYCGGVWVDRRPDRRILSLAVVAAGALLGLAPLVSGMVLGFAEGLGPRLGSLLSATLLFGPCLLVLGMAGPIAVRLASNDLRAAGKRVGSVYAVSTAGSLIGTLVTGFVLIPALETNQILTGTAALLIALGGVPLALQRRPTALAALLVPVLSLAAPVPKLPEGISVISRSHTPYGLVEVIEDVNRGVRLLRADHSIIGGQSMSDRSAVFAFLHVLEALRFLRPGAKDMLQIGLGIGSLPMALKDFGIRTDAVEIDPEVVRFARKHFGFSTAGQVHVEDARTFLQRTERRYDLIVHDTFTGGATPEHLLSLEVLQRIRALLRPGGVLALNLVGYDEGPKAEASRAVARTLRAAFPMVRSFRDSPREEPASLSNLIFFASEAPLDFRIDESAQFESDTCARLLRAFTAWEILQDVTEGPPITDAWNPLARLQLPIAEEHFAAMSELLPREVWLRY